MMLISGIMCLVVSFILLFQIKKTHDSEANQILKKFVWVFWSTLVLIGVHHVSRGVVAPWLSGILNYVGPLTDFLNAVAGIILSVYLSKRRSNKVSLGRTDITHEKILDSI